jgi:alpha-tubulin suppressor-like RCC1 family protein
MTGPNRTSCLAAFVTCALVVACSGGDGNSSTAASATNLWTWGPAPTPMRMNVPAGVRFASIAGGGGHALALDTSGHAWGWGVNGSGQLGNGSTRPTPDPGTATMPSGITFTAIAAGENHSLALDRNGRAWAWGYNHWGQLGNGSTTNSLVPAAVTMPSGVEFTAIAAGVHSIAVDNSGQAWGWGYNRDGELGDGTTEDRSTPVRVRMPAGVHFTGITAGADFTVALDQDGHAWSWGHNDSGELGLGTSGQRSTPVQLALPAGIAFTTIKAEGGHTVALDRNGQVWTWGFTTVDNPGPSIVVISSPTEITMPGGVVFSTVAVGIDHSLALDQSGQAWAWGDDLNHQLGDGKSRYAPSPVAVSMPRRVRFHLLAAVICCSYALSD